MCVYYVTFDLMPVTYSSTDAEEWMIQQATQDLFPGNYIVKYWKPKAIGLFLSAFLTHFYLFS